MYLMDTCVFLWFLEDDARLSPKAREVIESSGLYLSIASFWEIAIKKSIHKPAYLEQIQQLPMIHNDPFDRLIMATAKEENLTLITYDTKIRKYDIKVLW